jgi:hypothetical protein
VARVGRADPGVGVVPPHPCLVAERDVVDVEQDVLFALTVPNLVAGVAGVGEDCADVLLLVLLDLPEPKHQHTIWILIDDQPVAARLERIGLHRVGLHQLTAVAAHGPFTHDPGSRAVRRRGPARGAR